ncbi:type-F conjugative transfer system mating-pair stabilization protein TraN [Kosakonia sacchari]|uniref:type-F conjugative transfer system mating-pair stabilization protein TraN n=1 Tax=Kosakonia sacchari TaxID=1158459 RepID=UPI002ACE6AF3|nr:type-F conjugative transfer system mating-pair stabilization protein TraN [Kosakonia sacchari]MDZ7324879.1 type-F conjugative transfer system mating-pair stabilization protein TraN [Kosakonia sacchari]
MANPLLAAITGAALVISGYAAADAFSDGMSYGKGQQSTGTNAIKNFSPEEVIPGYTATPPETGYYGGVTSSGVDMTSPGMNELNTSDVGQTITESILNTPSDNKPSLDAPFITAGTDMQGNAESVIDPSFDNCQEQSATFTEITTHQCNRTPAAELYCTRTAGFGGEWKDTVENKYIIISHGQFSFSRSGKKIVFSFRAPEKGVVLNASLAITAGYAWLNSKVEFMNTTFNVSLLKGGSGTFPLGGAATMQLAEGEIISGLSCSGNGGCTGTVDDYIYNTLVNGSSTFTLTLLMQVGAKEWVPSVVWSESCPFDKSEEVLTTSTCTVAGGYKPVVVGGKEYQVYSDCWEYRDVYVSQEADNGTCGEYMNNTACTVNGTTCLESLAGICLSEAATFSCESKVSGTGMMCGGEFFCTDGSCAQGETGTNNMFAKAVSTLAAVAAAGEDIAEFNEADVRAFTGNSQSCRKVMAGFSNCCKDSGWGNDVGLASCSSEEKALGKAKEKKLTVKIGTYCAHKVLGVCVEKKESYCQFDSKLAQIVQDQGRKGQLGIGFGSASSPNCRGITIDELQSINFDTLNFANFYSDLENGSTIPEDNELLEKAKQIIADKVAEAGK